MEAVGVIQLMHDQELDNEEKAAKLEVLLPTLNNLASARLQQGKHGEVGGWVDLSIEESLFLHLPLTHPPTHPPTYLPTHPGVRGGPDGLPPP